MNHEVEREEGELAKLREDYAALKHDYDRLYARETKLLNDHEKLRERVMAKRDEWRETAIVIATPAAIVGLVGHDTEQMGKGLYYCAADIDEALKEMGSE